METDFSAVFQFRSAAFVSSQNQEASEHSNLALERGGVIKIQLAWNSKTQKEKTIFLLSWLVITWTIYMIYANELLPSCAISLYMQVRRYSLS